MWTGIVVVIAVWAIVSIAGSMVVGPLWLVAMGAALLAGARFAGALPAGTVSPCTRRSSA
jgi:hypothetical protein